MKFLYAPWRDNYTNSINKNDTNGSHPSCVFCTQLKENNDAANWIIKRFSHTYIMLNKFPYNAGHTLVLPLEHGGSLTALTPDTRRQLMEVANVCVQEIGKILNPPAFNLGINLGKESGGSVTEHLHVHVLPRWAGDTNFLPVFSNTKVISTDISALYTHLKNAFDDIEVK